LLWLGDDIPAHWPSERSPFSADCSAWLILNGVSDEYGLLIDHVHLRVHDLAASRKFYEAAVGALGLTITWEGDHALEFRELFLSDDAPPSGPIHFAFRAGTREAVERFHAAALSAGGRDNGVPGERGYHPGYFSAYVLDPDG
jgi:catechol 2,3-dioxygenase-like lactoylglutathione lyase family enzyme